MASDESEVFARLAAPYRHSSTSVVVHLQNSLQESNELFGNPGVGQVCAPHDVIYEIGSITKVFTALLLARLTVERVIDPDCSIGEICAAFAGTPNWITPKSLASHTSGLPRLHVPAWKALFGGVSDDPYAEFKREDLIAWMRHWRPGRRARKAAPVYSNFGFGLLGEVLAISQNTDYEELLRDKVLKPLGLHNTAITLSDDQLRRFAKPHAASGKPVVPWTFKAMAGAGALRSTSGDLARFSSHVITAFANPTTSLHRAIALAASPFAGHGPRGSSEPMAQCLGWISMRLDTTAPRMLFHDGGTAGSTSAIYICPDRRAAIVVLANRGVAAGMWSNLNLIRSNPHRIAHDYFSVPPQQE